jgi:hypothetical protein
MFVEKVFMKISKHLVKMSMIAFYSGSPAHESGGSKVEMLMWTVVHLFYCAGITTTLPAYVTSAMRANNLPSTTAPVLSEID